MAVSLDLKSDELLLRRIEAASAAAAPLPIQPPAPQPTGISSISKAEERETPAPLLRPKIAQPHFMYGMLRTHAELERVADKQTRLFETQVTNDMAEIERLETDKVEKLRKNAEENQKKATWGVLTSVAQYVASGAAIGLGIAVVASGVAAPAGACLIASGVVGIAGRILHDTGSYKAIAAWFTKSDELQKKIALQIEMGMFLVSFGLGLFGGGWAYGAHALSSASAATTVGKVAAGIGTAASVGAGATRFGMSFSEKKIAYIRSDLQNIDSETNQLYQNIYQNCRDVQNLADTAADIGDELKQAISASVVHQD